MHVNSVLLIQDGINMARPKDNKKKTNDYRGGAALLKKQMDSVRAADPTTKLFAMGDFNDDPVSPSLKNHFKAMTSY